MASPSGTALRWAATLFEPLMRTSQRAFFDQEMLELADGHTTWVMTFLAGVLSSLTSSLPASDSWRTVQVRSGGHPHYPDGRPFGTNRDAADLISPATDLEDAELDFETIALDDGLARIDADLLIRSFEGVSPALFDLVGIGEVDGAKRAVNAAANAIRWTEHRRRAYRPGVVDNWFQFIVTEWALRVDDFISGSHGDWFDIFLDEEISAEREELAALAQKRRRMD